MDRIGGIDGETQLELFLGFRTTRFKQDIERCKFGLDFVDSGDVVVVLKVPSLLRYLSRVQGAGQWGKEVSVYLQVGTNARKFDLGRNTKLIQNGLIANTCYSPEASIIEGLLVLMKASARKEREDHTDQKAQEVAGFGKHPRIR
jgi:hypothetical protein